MAFQFPWTNFHELNLDWFLSKFKQFTNNFLETTATAESVPYNAQPSVTVTGGELDDDTDIVDPFHFHFKIPQGMGILSLTVTYNVSDDDTQPVSGWTATKPAVNPGQYLWIRQTIILQNGVGQSYTYFVYYPVDGTIPIDAHPTENSPNAVSSGGVWSDINTFTSLTEDNIAWVETSNTATRSYHIGDYVIINGVLCKITANVANGGTLTSGTNYTVLGGSGGLANDIIDYYTYNSNTFTPSGTDTPETLIEKAITATATKMTKGFSHIPFSYPGHSKGGDVQMFICEYVDGTSLAVSGTLYIINGNTSTPGEAYIFSARVDKATSAITILKVSNVVNLALVSL